MGLKLYMQEGFFFERESYVLKHDVLDNVILSKTYSDLFYKDDITPGLMSEERYKFIKIKSPTIMTNYGGYYETSEFSFQIELDAKRTHYHDKEYGRRAAYINLDVFEFCKKVHSEFLKATYEKKLISSTKDGDLYGSKGYDKKLEKDSMWLFYDLGLDPQQAVSLIDDSPYSNRLQVRFRGCKVQSSDIHKYDTLYGEFKPTDVDGSLLKNMLG